jgi:hypothetical protein
MAIHARECLIDYRHLLLRGQHVSILTEQQTERLLQGAQERPTESVLLV